MRSGQLRHRLLFQIDNNAVTDPTTDSFGNAPEDLQTDFECWGAFEPLGSREFPAFEKRFSQTTARFRIRYVQGRTIDPAKHTIVFVHDNEASPVETSRWDIFPPLPADGKRWEMIIEAVEIK